MNFFVGSCWRFFECKALGYIVKNSGMNSRVVKRKGNDLMGRFFFVFAFY